MLSNSSFLFRPSLPQVVTRIKYNICVLNLLSDQTLITPCAFYKIFIRCNHSKTISFIVLLQFFLAMLLLLLIKARVKLLFLHIF